MNQEDYLYIVREGVPFGGENDRATFQLIVSEISPDAYPKNNMTVWMADVVGGGLALLQRLEVETIEEVISGVLTGHFVLVGSALGSVRFRRFSSTPDSYSLPGMAGLNSPQRWGQLIPLTEDQGDYLRDIERKSWKTSFSLPEEKKVLEALEFAKSASPFAKIGLKEALGAVSTLFFIGDLSRHKADPQNVSPAGSYALRVLEALGSEREESLRAIASFSSSKPDKAIPSGRLIETLLKPLEEVDLHPRKYVWFRESSVLFLGEDALVKTERAEKRHQEILSDCYRYLRNHGALPRFNRNIDLSFEGDNGLVLVEIKSASPTNFREQVLRGATQVAEYAFHFEKSGQKIDRKCVLIEVPPKFGGIEYYGDLLSSINIEMIPYDDRLPWPERAELLPVKT